MQNLGEISNVLDKCLSQINYIKGNYKLRMFIYIAAYYNYYTSNDMHIKILFLNNSLSIAHLLNYIQNHPWLYSTAKHGTHGVLSLNTIFA